VIQVQIFRSSLQYYLVPTSIQFQVVGKSRRQKDFDDDKESQTIWKII